MATRTVPTAPNVLLSSRPIQRVPTDANRIGYDRGVNATTGTMTYASTPRTLDSFMKEIADRKAAEAASAPVVAVPQTVPTLPVSTPKAPKLLYNTPGIQWNIPENSGYQLAPSSSVPQTVAANPSVAPSTVQNTANPFSSLFSQSGTTVDSQNPFAALFKLLSLSGQNGQTSSGSGK